MDNASTTQDPRVSVIIAAYNCAAFVGRAIRSALGQDIAGLEIIAVNDCSGDHSLAVLEAFAVADPRIRVLSHAANLGPGAARNRALAHARGDWVAVLDADDALPPGALHTLIMAAEQEKADMIAGNFCCFDHKAGTTSHAAFRDEPPTEPLGLVRFIDGARPYNQEPDFGVLKPVFRRAFLQQHGICYRPEIRHGEDFHFVVDALVAGARYIFARSVPGYLYTTRDSGLSRTRVDYAAMIRLTETMRKSRAFKHEPQARRALKERADALRRLELERAAR